MKIQGNDAWEATLDELQLSMTKGTFNTWLAGSFFVSQAESTYTVAVKSEHAKEWVDNRLKDNAEKLLRVITGEDSSLNVIVSSPSQNGQNGAVTQEVDKEVIEDESAGGKPFGSVKQNWCKVPKHFFEEILCSQRKASTARIVAAIIYNTLGNYDAFGNTPEWWDDVNNEDLRKAAGLRSKNSVKEGVRDALSNNWIKRKKCGEYTWSYALKFEWD